MKNIKNFIYAERFPRVLESYSLNTLHIPLSIEVVRYHKIQNNFFFLLALFNDHICTGRNIISQHCQLYTTVHWVLCHSLFSSVYQQ